MVRRDARNKRQPFLHYGKHLCTQPDGIDKVNDIWLELLQSSNKARSHEIELQAWVYDQRQSKSANNWMPSILPLKTRKGEKVIESSFSFHYQVTWTLHTTHNASLGSTDDCFMSLFIEVLQQTSQGACNAIHLWQKVFFNYITTVSYLQYLPSPSSSRTSLTCDDCHSEFAPLLICCWIWYWTAARLKGS